MWESSSGISGSPPHTGHLPLKVCPVSRKRRTGTETKLWHGWQIAVWYWNRKSGSESFLTSARMRCLVSEGNAPSTRFRVAWFLPWPEEIFHSFRQEGQRNSLISPMGDSSYTYRQLIRLKMVPGIWLAWASMLWPLWRMIWLRTCSVMASAMSVSRIRDSAADRFSMVFSMLD